VTRQSMNVLLQTLEREGLVTRPAAAPVGKALPTRLTASGRRDLAAATAAVRGVEVRMLAGLTTDEQASALRILRTMVRSLQA
jgi:DNA-binding MarR family transcriptional regulator